MGQTPDSLESSDTVAATGSLAARSGAGGGLLDSPAAVRAATVVVGVLLLLKLLLVAFVPPIGDEAYYWLWGQRPALSYLDHPPLHAWLLGLSSAVLGWNLFSLRVLTWGSLAVTVWVFRSLSRRIAPGRASAWFWIALAIYLASPLMLVMGSISFNDHLLVALCLLSIKFFLDFADAWVGRAGGFRSLWLAGLFLGLAALTKYNAALLGLAYALFLIIRPQFRPVLARWQAYAAAALSILVQLPSIYWNATDGFASYRFHLAGRWENAAAPDPVTIIVVLLVSVVALSVFVVGPMLRLYREDDGGFARSARLLGAILLATSTAAVLLVTVVAGESAPYWNILGYILALPLLAATLGYRTFVLHAASGILLVSLYVANLTVFPVRELVGWTDTTTYSNYDWDRIAAIVAAAEQAHPAGFVAATRYTTAAQLAFALHDPDVTDLSERLTQFDYWFDPKAHSGEEALVLAAPFIPIDYARTQFRQMTLLETIEVTRFGRRLGTYQLYWGQGYCGGSCK